MKHTARSFGHSLSGLSHALMEERNLRRFIIGHLILIFIAGVVQTDLAAIIIVTAFAGFFIVIELLNTALERLADTIDDCEKKRNGGHFHIGIKQAKDVAAAASLVALLLYLVVTVLAILPFILLQFIAVVP